MNIKKLSITAALAASLLIPAGVMLAQDDTATPEVPAEQNLWGPGGPRDGGFGFGERGGKGNGEFGGRHGGREGRGGMRGLRMGGELLSLVEEYTGLTQEELRTAHQNGQTLAEVIEANDGSVDDFVAAAVEQVNTQIDEAVTNGRITEERAELMKENLSEQITAWVNGEHPMRQGQPPVPAAPATDDAAADL